MSRYYSSTVVQSLFFLFRNLQSEKPDRDLRRLQEDEIFLDSLYHVFKPTILQHQEQEDNQSNWFIFSKIALQGPPYIFARLFNF